MGLCACSLSFSRSGFQSPLVAGRAFGRGCGKQALLADYVSFTNSSRRVVRRASTESERSLNAEPLGPPFGEFVVRLPPASAATAASSELAASSCTFEKRSTCSTLYTALRTTLHSVCVKMDGWMAGRTDGGMDGGMDGWVDGVSLTTWSVNDRSPRAKEDCWASKQLAQVPVLLAHDSKLQSLSKSEHFGLQTTAIDQILFLTSAPIQ